MRVLVSIACVALVAGACSSSDGGSDAGPPDPSRTTTSATKAATVTTNSAPIAAGHDQSSYAAATCPMQIPTDLDVPIEVHCGYLTVPENREVAHSKMIKLAVARIHQVGSHPAVDPVVQLEGGPGFSSLPDIEGYGQSSVLGKHDYVIWDQRGTGFSTPSLDCPEADDAVWTTFTTNEPAKAEGATLEAGMQACKARLVTAGVDFDGYDTVQNAADLEDLRLALKIPTWNLRGVSYGSALAMEEMRTYPGGIRSVLLDSVVTPDGQFGAVGRGESALRSFGELEKACDAQATCKAKYGSTTELMARAAKALDDRPEPVDITEPGTGKVRHVKIDGQDLYAGIFRAMYDESLIPAVPQVLLDVAEGRRGIIKTLAEQNIPFVTDQYEAMTTSVDCADRESTFSTQRFEDLVTSHPEVGEIMYLGAAELGCGEWGVQAAPEPFNTKLTKDDFDGPVLVMAGRFDPITPPAGTMAVAKALGTKALFFPNAGHGAVGSSDCARNIYLAFLDDPTKEPDATCMATLGPPKFA